MSNEANTHQLRRKRVSRISPELTKALKSEPLHGFEFKARWEANSSDPSCGWEVFQIRGYISVDVLREVGIPKFAKFEETDVILAAANGFTIRPDHVRAMTGYGVYDAYDAPSDFSQYLFERLYEIDEEGRCQGLKPEIADAVGDEMWEGTTPFAHHHIETIFFADGFASRQDLEVLLAHASVRFGDVTSPSDGIMTVDAHAIPGLDPTGSGHEQVKAIGLMEELGFAYVNDLFIYQSLLGSAEEARAKRLKHHARASRIVRKPI